MTTGRSLPLADITVDWRVQVRVAGLDEDAVAAYAAVFASGGQLPPVVVFHDERNGALYLADGFHRVAAARQAGLTEIAAEVRSGGLVAAIEYAEEANLHHGLRLSNRDKRHILLRRLARGHVWASWSNRALAAALGVAEATIRNWREELEQSGAQNCAPAQRVGLDGKTYQVRNPRTARGRAAAPRYVADADVVQNVPEEGIAGAHLDAAGALEQLADMMQTLRGYLDEFVAWQVPDERLLRTAAVRAALHQVWRQLPVLDEAVRHTARRVAALLRQSGD